MTDRAAQYTLTFSVPEDHPSYAGHFPDNPLVPGALLLRWIIELLKQESFAVHLIKQCKFLHIVKPGDQLQLQVTANNGSLTVEIFCANTPVAKAQCLYHQTDAHHA